MYFFFFFFFFKQKTAYEMRISDWSSDVCSSDLVINNIKRQAVPIRSVVLMVLAEQDPALLSTSEGKQRLQRQLTVAINDVLREKEGFGGIDNVYFTSLVIQ